MCFLHSRDGNLTCSFFVLYHSTDLTQVYWESNLVGIVRITFNMWSYEPDEMLRRRAEPDGTWIDALVSNDNAHAGQGTRHHSTTPNLARSSRVKKQQTRARPLQQTQVHRRVGKALGESEMRAYLLTTIRRCKISRSSVESSLG